MSAYPFASDALVTETLGVLGASHIAAKQQTLLQQFLVACAVGGGAPAPTTPDTPTGFTATPGNQFTTLCWDAQAEADTFTINYSLTNDFGTSTELTAAATGMEFTHSAGEGIVVGERYYYWIQAVNNVGASDFSTSVVARSFVALADGATGNLVTPSGSWMLTTLFFRTGGNLPFGCVVAWNGGLDLVASLGDGTWENQLTFEAPYDAAISGAFNFGNGSGSSVTFWNTEP
jgi:hypothetical protein